MPCASSVLSSAEPCGLAMPGMPIFLPFRSSIVLIGLSFGTTRPKVATDCWSCTLSTATTGNPLATAAVSGTAPVTATLRSPDMTLASAPSGEVPILMSSAMPRSLNRPSRSPM